MTYDDYRLEKTKEGREYELWVAQQYPKVYGSERTLEYFTTKEGQFVGETKQGVEVKYDGLIDKHSRIYIETQEKAHIDNVRYVPSGIYREDNTKLYLIGDYGRWFLFSKKHLQWLDKLDPPFLFRPKPTGTSIAFCIPIKNAKQLALDYQRFDGTLWKE